MPHGIPLGKPDRYLNVDGHISIEAINRMSKELRDVVCWLCLGVSIGVHNRTKRNRYTIAGKPITRRTIDRLVYFGVLDETELNGGCDGSN